MTESLWDTFKDRIAWEGSVHVSCEEVDANREDQDALERLRMSRLNAGVLASLGMLGDGSVDAGNTDLNTATLMRLDAKLDMLLEMFNRHLLGRLALPPRYPVRMNTRGILIFGYDLPPEDARVRVEVYFDACAGMPMEISGKVSPTSAVVGHFVYFDKLADNVREGMEHLIFSQQRKKIAAAKLEAKR